MRPFYYPVVRDDERSALCEDGDAFAQAQEAGLADGIVNAVIVGHRIDLPIGRDGQAFELVEGPAAGAGVTPSSEKV